MSLLNVFNIAGSGLSAQSMRLNTTASNIANADSVSSSSNTVYRARYPVFSAYVDDVSNQYSAPKVRLEGIVESQSPLRMQYRPDHPMANEDGNVFMPNVNAVEEMANMISASRSFQTNIEIMNTSKQMLLKTLSLGQ
ncbi:MAG: flagellar basal body rod protein FlgC [Thiohalomonadales bacterium]